RVGNTLRSADTRHPVKAFAIPFCLAAKPGISIRAGIATCKIWSDNQPGESGLTSKFPGDCDIGCVLRHKHLLFDYQAVADLETRLRPRDGAENSAAKGQRRIDHRATRQELINPVQRCERRLKTDQRRFRKILGRAYCNHVISLYSYS